ncbi:rhomboid family protein [Colletotrichum karsti]|uniref:Rhomboid family protein n=1 Tax=Colletotrichum karsti TaxID=1095194 RepID=A0A9P6IGZ7_9PEZI|nr:rhomboid family protein [Colletotrichum karsti]KAF9882397.1 rhomboid family protein [Colletotrichum karsti]
MFSQPGYLDRARLITKHYGPLWTAILYGVPLTNLAVHLAWLLALHPALASLPLPFDRRRLRDFLHRNFMLRPGAALEPLTLLTSAFSHIQPLHLFVNMSTYNTYARNLYVMGTSPLRFVLLALGSGLAASAAFVLNARRRRRAGKSDAANTAVGASGILTGFGTALAVMYPTMRVRLSGTRVMLSLREVLVAMFAVDVLCLGTETETGVGHSGHVGGALFGLVYALGRKYLRYRNL